MLPPTAKIDGGGVVGGDRSCFNGYSLYQKPGFFKKPGFLVVWGRTRLLGQLAQSREKMAEELMDEERIAWEAESDRLWKVIPRATPSNLS